MKALPDRNTQQRFRRWRLFAFFALHAALGIHLWLWYGLGWRIFGAIDFQELFRNAIEKNVWTVGALSFGFLLLAGWLWGRFFCGWLCHIGQVYDLLEPLAKRLGIPRRRLRLRAGLWFASFILIWYFAREAVLHRLTGPETQARLALAETAPWELLPGWFQGTLTLLVVWLVLPLFMGARPFCRTLCPWGAAFALTQPLARLKVRRSGSCTLCGQCDEACPMDIDVSHQINLNFKVSSPACTNCLACIASCPSNALSWAPARTENRAARPKPPALEARAYTPRLEFAFWCLVLLVGLTYSELYGIGIFLAYSLGLVVACFSLEFSLQSEKRLPYRLLSTKARHIALVLLWLVIAKDAFAHRSYLLADFAWRKGQKQEAQRLYERCDRLFWVSPNLLFYRLYAIYKENGQTEKARALFKRYEARRPKSTEPPANQPAPAIQEP